MASVAKIVEKMKNQPNGIRFEEAEKVLNQVNMTDTKLSHYMSLPYTKTVVKRDDEDGLHYISSVLELDGCSSDGTTPEEALRNLDEAMECYLESCIIHNDPIPEPVSEDSFSGKFLVRVPKSLHRRLTYESQKEGISLNQYALYKLSQ